MSSLQINFCKVCNDAFTTAYPIVVLCLKCQEEKTVNRAAELEKLYKVFKEQYEAEQAEQKELKLFKVTIPSQTLGGDFSDRKEKKLLVGKITDYGFIKGREIVVLASDYSRLWDQCLRELGCEAQDVDLKVEEIEGPFKHGTVLAYTEL